MKKKIIEKCKRLDWNGIAICCSLFLAMFGLLLAVFSMSAYLPLIDYEYLAPAIRAGFAFAFAIMFLDCFFGCILERKKPMKSDDDYCSYAKYCGIRARKKMEEEDSQE